MPVSIEEYIRLLETMIEQQKQHIQSQDARILEQEADHHATACSCG